MALIIPFFASGPHAELMRPAGEPQPDETGEIMVVLYHGVGPRETSWTRSADNFRQDLNLLYQGGYRPVSLVDFVQNRIDTPSGFTPVVLTFDDGRADNFNIVERDQTPIIDPNSAVGILEEFHNAHPDFPLEATFFLNGMSPFGQKEWVGFKLNHIVERGMDVGNHMLKHVSLNAEGMTPDDIARLIGAEAKFLQNQITVQPDYQVNTLALCYGRRPRELRHWRLLVRGKYRDFAYENIAVLNVGAGPAPSPATVNFNPFSIPRIRANTKKAGRYHLRAWLKRYEKLPKLRYVSDGNPLRITVPRDRKHLLDKAKLSKRILSIY